MECKKPWKAILVSSNIVVLFIHCELNIWINLQIFEIELRRPPPVGGGGFPVFIMAPVLTFSGMNNIKIVKKARKTSDIILTTWLLSCERIFMSYSLKSYLKVLYTSWLFFLHGNILYISWPVYKLVCIRLYLHLQICLIFIWAYRLVKKFNSVWTFFWRHNICMPISFDRTALL